MLAIHKRLKMVAVGLISISLNLVNIGEKAKATTAIDKIPKIKISVIIDDLSIVWATSFILLAGANKLFLFKLTKS